MEELRRGFRIEGRVQGVGFRWWTRRAASRLGLVGFVRNLPDGAVEVQAQGDPRDIENLATLLKGGPPAARVEEVVEIEAAVDAEATTFEILRTP